MKRKRYDSNALGFVLGILCPVLGFLIYGTYWAWKFNKTFGYFFHDIFLGTPTFKSSIIALSLLVNLIPFFIFIRSERNKSARGVLLAVFIYVPFVVYYRFA
jgi:hypothetical protein